MFCILAVPKIKALKNLVVNINYPLALKLFAACLLSLLMMIAVYTGSLQLLTEDLLKALVFEQLSSLLSIFFLIVLSITLCSNTFLAFGSLFFSKDLELLNSSPVKPRAFLLGKSLLICLGSSWAYILFGVPFLLAIGSAFGFGLNYWLTCLVISLAIIFASAQAGASIAIIFARLVPLYNIKILRFLLILFTIVSLIALPGFLSGTNAATETELQEKLFASSLGTLTLLPSTWAGNALALTAWQSYLAAAKWILLLIALNCLLYFGLRLIYLSCYQRAYSNLISGSRKADNPLSKAVGIIEFDIPLLPKAFQAFLRKDMRSFSRDLTQTLQLVFIIGLCTTYLYNFQNIIPLDNLENETRFLWESVLALLNIAMASIVIIAICSRFVFPSISMEGRAFWILASAPLGTKRYLRAKLFFWLLPISLIFGTLILCGAFATQASITSIFMSLLFGACLGLGIVGLGVGLGAGSANFNWDNPTELTHGFSQIVFITAALALSIFNLMLVGCFMFASATLIDNWNFNEWILPFCLTSFLLFVLNFAVCRGALSFGEAGLKKWAS